MLYIVIAVLMFGLLIALHELGHFIAAKACGVKVNEFAVGMGPKLLGRKGKETEYTLRALPIGGYCAMEGEGEASDDPRAFSNRPIWQRLIILLAGVAMNFLTGFLLILFLYATVFAYNTPVVSGYVAGWTAQEQGIQVGDRIVAVDGHAILQTSDIALFLSRSSDDRVDVTLKREGKRVELKGYQFYAVTGADGATQDYYLGINATPGARTPGALARQALLRSVSFVRSVWMALSDMITGAVGLRDMSGPFGIFQMAGELGEAGAQAAPELGMSPFAGAMINILYFASFIAINLAVMNLLPIPALDGGQVLFLLVDKVYSLFTHRRIDPKYLGYVNMAGMVCLLLLMAAVTVSDLFKLFGR